MLLELQTFDGHGPFENLFFKCARDGLAHMDLKKKIPRPKPNHMRKKEEDSIF